MGIQHRVDGHGFETVLFQVDQVYELLGVLAYGFSGIGRLEQRVAERHQPRLIVGDCIHGAGAQSPHQPQEAVLLAYLR